MFDIGWQELFVLAVLAIIVIGPSDLPRAVRTVTHWIKKGRGMARELQDGLDDMVREADLDDIKAEANKAMNLDDFDPTGEVGKLMDMSDVEKEMSDAAQDLKDSTAPEAAPGGDDPAPAAEPTSDKKIG